MKKSMSLAAMALMATSLLTAGTAHASYPGIREWQSPKNTRKNVINFHPLNLGFGQVLVDYERGLSNYVSLVASPLWAFAQLDRVGSTIGLDGGAYAVGGDVGTKIYVGGNALNGFFVNPLVGYHYAEGHAASVGRTSLSSVDAHAVRAGGRLGYQWFPAKRMVINLAGGAMFNHVTAKGSHSSMGVRTISNSSVTPDLKFGLGLLF